MKGKSRTPLFLIETVVMLLLFSAFAAICLRLFAAARQTSRKSSDLSHAVSWAQSAADCWKSADADASLAAAILGTYADVESFSLHFDKDWRQIAGAGEFTLILREDGVNGAQIAVFKADPSEPIFTLRAKAVANG